MLQKDNRYKILELFFEDPNLNGGGFQLREISRKVNVATPSVKKYLNEIEKEGLIIKAKHRIHSYPIYYANRDNNNFKFLKKIDTLTKINESGILEYISEKCMPNAIILFGSASIGEDLKESDIDLFVLSDKEKVDLMQFEKKLSKKINIFFSDNFNKLSKELRNNIINGIILKGYLKVF